ncbi:MAG: phytoene desaturase family protein [Gemmatimonadota bacterium]
MDERYDTVIVGAGPNGLAAAIVLAQAGQRVLVREATAVAGGGVRSAELTLPGYQHDICSAVYPLALSSPFFRSLPLAEHGLEWLHAPACLAHPFDDGTAAVLERSLAATADALRADGEPWRRLLQPFADRWTELAADVLRPIRVPRHPFLMTRFGIRAVRSARSLARATFHDEPARALFAGTAAHSMLPLTRSPTAAFGITLIAAAHAVGWPIVRGGSQRFADALVSYFRSLGGEVQTGAPVENIDELLPGANIVLDLTPRQVLRIAGHRLPARYRNALARYRYGAGAFKVDWALSEPIPWTAPECRRAVTVHLGGTLEEFTISESAAHQGKVASRPFVLLVQPTLFDAARAPAGKHIAWAYCHVPFNCSIDVTQRIEDQVERFAPGFRDCIVARSTMAPSQLERHDANLIGGDISGGLMSLRQLVARPVARFNPYTTPLDGLFLCSAATPPGAAVHGMCGYYAAHAVLGRRRGTK